MKNKGITADFVPKSITPSQPFGFVLNTSNYRASIRLLRVHIFKLTSFIKRRHTAVMFTHVYDNRGYEITSK